MCRREVETLTLAHMMFAWISKEQLSDKSRESLAQEACACCRPSARTDALKPHRCSATSDCLRTDGCSANLSTRMPCLLPQAGLIPESWARCPGRVALADLTYSDLLECTVFDTSSDTCAQDSHPTDTQPGHMMSHTSAAKLPANGMPHWQPSALGYRKPSGSGWRYERSDQQHGAILPGPASQVLQVMNSRDLEDADIKGISFEPSIPGFPASRI